MPTYASWRKENLPPATARRRHPLASTEITPNQAFAYGGKTLGLQFHIEAEPACIERWLIGHTCELAITGIDVPRLRRELQDQLPAIARKSRTTIEAWLEAVKVD